MKRHMSAEWHKGSYWVVETTYGTHFIPRDVDPHADNLGLYVHGDVESFELERGWMGRLSAPGYLDSTDWVVGKTQAEVKDQLANMYELCPKCLLDFDEDYVCQNCGCRS